MYIITGASGNIGKILATELLSKGKKVRVIARNAEKLQPLVDKGAEAAVGDLSNLAFVKKAFEGATAAYCMIPPNFHTDNFFRDQCKIADNLFEAVSSSGVKHVLLLSSVGAHLRKGAGVVDGLGYMEEKFSSLTGVNIVNLRPTYFMENLFGQIGVIKHAGIMGSAIKGDLAIPLVATRDIAREAFKLLNDLKFTGHSTKFVLGPRDISFNEIASVFGKAIHKPDLVYVQFSYEDAKNGLVQSGFVSANVADLYNGLAEAFNNGTAMNGHTRNADNTSPTSIEEFSNVFAKVYGMELEATV